MIIMRRYLVGLRKPGSLQVSKLEVFAHDAGHARQMAEMMACAQTGEWFEAVGEPELIPGVVRMFRDEGHEAG